MPITLELHVCMAPIRSAFAGDGYEVLEASGERSSG